MLEIHVCGEENEYVWYKCNKLVLQLTNDVIFY